MVKRREWWRSEGRWKERRETGREKGRGARNVRGRSRIKKER